MLPKIMNKKIVVNFISPDEKTRRSCQTDDWRNAEWSPTQLKVSISPTIFSVQTVQKDVIFYYKMALLRFQGLVIGF